MGVLSFSKVSFHFYGFETGTFEGCSTRSLVHSGFRKDQRRITGEPGICDKLTEDYNNPKVSMALNMVKEGYVAVAVDNAAAGEASDLECYDKGWNYDYDVVSRFLLELGWSWLGYTSYHGYASAELDERPVLYPKGQDCD